jgi:hypothetical protein
MFVDSQRCDVVLSVTNRSTFALVKGVTTNVTFNATFAGIVYANTSVSPSLSAAWMGSPGRIFTVHTHLRSHNIPGVREMTEDVSAVATRTLNFDSVMALAMHVNVLSLPTSSGVCRPRGGSVYTGVARTIDRGAYQLQHFWSCCVHRREVVVTFRRGAACGGQYSPLHMHSPHLDPFLTKNSTVP